MEILYRWIDGINDVLWSYLLVALLLGCAVWFTLRRRGVQFRMLGEMVRVLGESAGSGPRGERHVSSFQAFAVSLASRVGTGNLAGVATAIAVGGPGAVFWMWVIALLGASSAFVESTLAQLYKRKGRDSYIGGPAYYMERGLGKRWMGVLFAVLISVTFGFAFNSVQSNTICAAWEGAFGFDHHWVGAGLALLTLLVIFGGIHRIARVSGVVVPVMALGYIVLALGVVLFNFRRLPEVVELIVANAFGWVRHMGRCGYVRRRAHACLVAEQAALDALHERCAGTAATAHVSHPVKQGLIQTLGVFTDTLVICTCTAFIILFGGVPDASLSGIQLTQAALVGEIGPAGGIFVAVAIFLFAFSSIIGNYYYGEANVRFITRRPWVLTLYRVLVGGMVLFGALATLDLAWSLADITMAFMTLINLVAIILLGRQAFLLLVDYVGQRRRGIKNPVYTRDRIPSLKDKAECW